MSRRLPPLNALRAFEVAARHLSFTRAADELFVTQAAVSHQIKRLEEELGVRLFIRRGRTLLLTEDAQRYLPSVREAFDRLTTATDQLLSADAEGNLTVSVISSFAALWLVPRLSRFRARHPDIDVRVHAADELVDFARDDVDLAIRTGLGRWPGLRVDKLLEEDVYPVCSPELAKGPSPLCEPADLRRHTLLHEAHVRIDWRTWLTTAGVTDIDAGRGPSFSHGSMAVQAAMDGQGVALGRSPLVTSYLADGRLVKPFEMTLQGDYAHYVVCPLATADHPKIVAFREWLLDEAAKEPADT